jgi:hypothetical protein
LFSFVCLLKTLYTSDPLHFVAKVKVIKVGLKLYVM